MVWTNRGGAPRELHHNVSRTALVRRLTEVEDDVPLVLLVAPVGYGKTTTILEWSRTVRSPVAWVKVTARVRGRARLMEELILALPTGPARELPATAWPSPKDLPPEEAADVLASSIADVDMPVTIVLDDLHLLGTRSALDLVVTLARRLPAGNRIIAMSDRRPRLHLGRLRSEQRCLELGPGDLAFSEEEVAGLLRGAGLDLGPQAVRELVRRTEGWPTGVRLTARVLRERPDPTTFVAQLDGTVNVIADYFRGEVLAHLSGETTRFLLRTAVLDRMCASLCDAVLGRSGSAAWLEEVNELGLFVVPEDDRGEWFRYHRLFREMLRRELRRREPGQDLRILRRAALWYDARGAHEEAITRAIAGRAKLTAARLIVAHGQQINSAGRTRQISRWLDLLDEDAFDLYPPLTVVAAWIRALTGDAPGARRALSRAERSALNLPVPNGSTPFLAAVAGVRALLAPNGIDGMLADAECAERLEPPGSRWHTPAALTLGVAKWLTGSPADAARAFEQAVRFGRDEQRPEAACALAEHALMAADAGDWAFADACAEQARSLVESAGLREHVSALPVYAAAARVDLHRGDTRRAWHDAREALRLYQDPSPAAMPWMAVQAAVVLGRVFAELGDIAAAQRKLTEARRHLTLLPTKGLLPASVEQLARLVESGLRREGVADATGLTKAELRVLELLPTHYTLGEIGDELRVSRNTVKAHVAAIYRKLDAVTRAEAVRRAQGIGLLGPEPTPPGSCAPRDRHDLSAGRTSPPMPGRPTGLRPRG